MPGRIAYYIHSDSVSPDKGGCMVKITTQTDFASKEDMVYDLARSVAKAAYGYGFTSWQEFADSNNDDYIKSITDRMDGIRNELKEKVEITDIVILRV